MSCYSAVILLFVLIISFSLTVIPGKGFEEASEEAQCAQALDARQAWWSFCKFVVLVYTFLSYLFSCYLMKQLIFLITFYHRPPSHLLVLTSPGSACL